MRVAGSDGHLHTSNQLKGRQERLTRLHMEHNAKQLQRVGQASIYGPPNLRTSGLTAHPFKPPQQFQKGMMFSTELPPPAPPVQVEGVPIDLIIDGLRRRMHQKGLDSIMGLEKYYKSLDKDGNGRLEFPEFLEGMMQQNILRSDSECLAIFKYFDEDNSGALDYREFMSVVKGKLSEARKAVVNEAFDFLDLSGDGVLQPEDLKQRYRSFAHPDVRAGIRSEEDTFKEFLEHFDTVCGDLTVSRVEFQRYYEGMSATIPNDKFFDTMIRNTWHLPGALGGHCLRVHVTRAAGHEMDDPQAWGLDIQKTVEIRPDIGLQRHDPHFFEECAKRLNDLGYPDVANIEVLGRY